MRLYRQTPPEYRALVVENERDFRRELVYLVESLDFGISVTGEAADYDDALACLAEDTFDLLITDVNLTDAARFEVGHRDDIALAAHARTVHGLPCIFLTAFADFDPAVVTRAAACDPIGFIQKQGDTLNAQTQSLIRLALRRLDTVRRGHETRQQLEAVIEQVGRALFYIDAEGHIVDFSDAAAQMFGLPDDALVDAHWEDVLRVEAPRHAGVSVLARAIADGRSTHIPAMALQLSTGASLLASAHVLPTEHLREPCTLLLLRDLSEENNDIARLQVEEGACLAIVGVFEGAEQPGYDATDLRIAMLDLHALLLAQVRAGDRVGVPTATTISIQLPRTAERDGTAILVTLLGAVEAALQERHPALQLRAGVAHRGVGRSVHATAAAATDALERARLQSGTRVVGGRRPGVPRRREYAAPGTRPLLSRGFAVTEALLTIPMREGRDLAGLAQDFGAAIDRIPDLLAFGAYSTGEDGRPRWLFGQQRDGNDEWQTCRDDDLPAAARAALASDAARDPGGLRLLFFEGWSLSLSALQGPAGMAGSAFLFARHNGPPGRAPSEREKELSAVSARHLAQLIERCTDFAPGATPAVPVTSADYNPWSLQRERSTVAELCLLLAADTPLALIGETGLERAGLLAEAARQWQDNPLWPIVDLACELWPELRAPDELLGALQVPAETVLLLREPQHLPPRTQALLARALLTRRLPVPGSSPPLPRLRLAVTLPELPATLAARGELAPELASALDAGTLRLAALRDNAADARRWAQVLLDAECALAGVPARHFSADALAALATHPWTGNLAELRQRLRRAVAQSTGSAVSALDLGLFHLRAVP